MMISKKVKTYDNSSIGGITEYVYNVPVQYKGGKETIIVSYAVENNGVSGNRYSLAVNDEHGNMLTVDGNSMNEPDNGLIVGEHTPIALFISCVKKIDEKYNTAFGNLIDDYAENGIWVERS